MTYARIYIIVTLQDTFEFCNATYNTGVTPCFADEKNFQNWYYQQREYWLYDDEGFPQLCGTISQSM